MPIDNMSKCGSDNFVSEADARAQLGHPLVLLLLGALVDDIRAANVGVDGKAWSRAARVALLVPHD